VTFNSGLFEKFPTSLKGLVLIATFLVSPVSAAHGQSFTPAMVRNAYACIPSIADPPDEMVQFRDGKFSSTSIPFAEMRAMGSGVLSGQPAVLTEIVWNTGGSGNWEVVALFRQIGGKAVSVGVYWPGPDLPDGGTMVGTIVVRNNKIYLYGDDPLHGRSIPTPLIVTPSVFVPCRTAVTR
jgi:hypothetical protein